MKILQLISVVSIIIFLNSCQEAGLAGKIANLEDKAEDALENIQDYKTIDFSKDKLRAHELNEQLMPYFSSLNKPSQKILIDLTNTEKANKKFHSSFDKLETDLNYSIEQLNALYLESKQDSISEEQAKQYFIDEEKVLNHLLQIVSANISQTKYLQEHYAILIPKAEHIVDSIVKIK